MRRNAALTSCLALALGAIACQDPKTSPTDPSTTTTLEPKLQSVTGPKVTRGKLRLPASAQMSDPYFADAVDRAINPSDYVCDPSTPVVDWLNGEIDRSLAVEQDLLLSLVFDYAADQLPQAEAIVLLTEDTPQYFGYNGEYTNVMQKTERDVKRFWDIQSDDIQLIGMHGTMLLDVDRVAATYVAAFEIAPGVPVPPALAQSLAQDVHDLMVASQTLNGGNHPLFSFNAFAFTTFGGPIPDKIVMGDGILAGYEAVGFKDVAPQAVYAHEFGHHIQYENGYINELPPGNPTTQAEVTRYRELMADAFSAYYLTHKHGGTMNRHRVAEFLQVFFQIGDCAFANPGHHGTPNQRMRAAQFGFDVADQAQHQGHILSSDAFHDLFVAAYPAMVAPDAQVASR